MHQLPDALLHGPVTRAVALDAGVRPRVLEGARFRRVFPAVYHHRDHEMSFEDQVVAATYALPGDARMTGITRLQVLGLDLGERSPLRFVREGDLHVDLPGIFLHRTVLMPPCDQVGVAPAAAFMAYCAEARVIDALKVGDWLLYRRHMCLEELRDLAASQPWRRGAAEAAYVVEWLNGRCRSLPESDLFNVLRFAGLPEPEVNQTLHLSDSLVVTPDLWFRRYNLAGEYEGAQHQEERGQYNSDIDRYADYRRFGVRYVQVTTERMHRSRDVARRFHKELVAGGYDGPAPEFGVLWATLFARLRDVVPPHWRQR